MNLLVFLTKNKDPQAVRSVPLHVGDAREPFVTLA